ncbi:nucleotide pyrophosphohydrolase [beta proteobacterium MWH-UniP1]
MASRSTANLQKALTNFVKERDWEQFHTPKNLATSVSIEAAELLEVFQWLTPIESENLTANQIKRAGDEIADVYLYLLLLCKKLGFDLEEIAFNKLADNVKKYPADKARGSSKKYTEL